MTNPYWNFKKANPKYGYVNNPFQADEAEHTNKHHPCGYWPVGAPLSSPTRIAYGHLFGAGRNLYYSLGLYPVTGEISLFTQSGGDTYVKKVVAGNSCSIVIKTDDTLWVVGLNTYGHLGTGDTVDVQTWTQILGSWLDVDSCAYGGHTLAIKTDGTLWAAGRNDQGQLGIGNTDNKTSFTQVGTSNKWRKVYVAPYHSFALNDDGNVFTFGHDNYGAMGLGVQSSSETSPVYVSSLSNVSQIACLFNSTLAIDTSGTLFGTGYNSMGELGFNDTTKRLLFTENTLIGPGIKFINGGTYNITSLLIDRNDLMYGAGTNGYNVMGIPGTGNKLVFTLLPGEGWLSCGTERASSIALKINGELWGVGRNTYGQLGLGDKVARTEWERIGSDLWNAVNLGDFHAMAINWTGTSVWM